jgi:hypothetical protein
VRFLQIARPSETSVTIPCVDLFSWHLTMNRAVTRRNSETARRLGGTYRFHLQGGRVSQRKKPNRSSRRAQLASCLSWRRYVPPKRWVLSDLHVVKLQTVRNETHRKTGPSLLRIRCTSRHKCSIICPSHLIVTMLRAGRPRNLVSILGRGKKFSSP